MSVILASSVPHLMRSLNRLDRSVYAWPRTTEIARRIDDLPAPFGPQMRFSPGSRGTYEFSYDMKFVSTTPLIIDPSYHSKSSLPLACKKCSGGKHRPSRFSTSRVPSVRVVTVIVVLRRNLCRSSLTGLLKRLYCFDLTRFRQSLSLYKHLSRGLPTTGVKETVCRGSARSYISQRAGAS